eukprot:TRINITY_DN4230_c0_g1_i2.p2 TRINITY_DN4230_c0_g1~~TRINITY_DN4230_c0_g1_i2.p2  ORF type:complete len:196 (+),score=41.57 TRINITY_DN4230_c0_g1_i2:117-704(+)
MRLYVIALQGRVFALEADGERTVWDLKGAVAKHSNVAPPMQCISCGGKALDNGMTLRECAGAANVLTLDMSPRSLPVAVRTLAGEFDVEARTVPELRERIQQRTGINAARQRLFVDDEEHTQNGATLVQLPVGVVDVRKVSVEGMFLLVHRWGQWTAGSSAATRRPRPGQSPARVLWPLSASCLPPLDPRVHPAA